jgi:hypothetical protein
VTCKIEVLTQELLRFHIFWDMMSLGEWVLTVLRNIVCLSSGDKEFKSTFWTVRLLKMKVL